MCYHNNAFSAQKRLETLELLAFQSGFLSHRGSHYYNLSLYDNGIQNNHIPVHQLVHQ